MTRRSKDRQTPLRAPDTLLEQLRTRALSCTDCPLWRDATQTVFGEGAPAARLMLVGEQPGDAEDRSGKPFVGPAGAVLDRALSDAGIARDMLYVTNAVKHFKWEPRGKRRLHKTPAQMEIDACSQWLNGELEAVKPSLVVCLGATATRALLGPRATLSRYRGSVIERDTGPSLLVTVHPSFILRVPPQSRDSVYQGLVADLRIAGHYLAAHESIEP
jgi:DNA polymerase